jgi:colanic acid biosynthesis protein WcaH
MQSNYIPEKLYRKIQKVLPIACVDLLVKYDKGVLLCKRKNNPAKDRFWLPGGRIFKGESLEHAVKRKLKEETGLKAKSIKFVGNYTNYFKKGFYGFPFHAVISVFLVEAENKPIKLDNQHSDFKIVKKLDNKLPAYIRQVIIDSGIFGNQSNKNKYKRSFFKYG